ncbi:MAG TPA: squalene/phytoene synthase family protein [Sphingomicrobium sp.]
MAERQLDYDREVALQQLPPGVRPAFKALWNLDLAFADVVATSTDPNLGAIRLAWWRERLEVLDEGAVPAEPRLQLVANELLPRRITGAELSKLEDAWLPLLQPLAWDDAQVEGLKLRGRVLFGIGANLLGASPTDAETAGELWSLSDGAHHCSDSDTRNLLLREAAALAPTRAAAKVRPLTLLAALSAHDACPRGSFSRGLTALRHRYRGTFPRG